MCREEGLRLTNDFERLTLPSERNVDYAGISQLKNTEIKNEIL
jgi:hypothetical protein